MVVVAVCSQSDDSPRRPSRRLSVTPMALHRASQRRRHLVLGLMHRGWPVTTVWHHPGEPPSFAAVKTIEVEASVVIDQPRERVFAAAAGETAALARHFKGYAPLIPGIVEAHVEGGDPPRAGALRPVKLSDGTSIVERILAFEVPSKHGYEMAQMNTLQRLICTNMVSEWRFTDEGKGTRIVWHYAIHAKPWRGGIGQVVGHFFQKAMQRCLDSIAREMNAAR